MLREFELQQAWSNYWYFRPSRKSFDTAQMPFGCKDGPAAGLGWCPTSHCQGCAEQFGRTEPFGKYIMGPWEIVAGSPANCSLSGRPGVEDDVLMKTAMNCSRSRWRQLRNHFTNQVTICLPRCWKKGPGLLWCHPGMSSSIETGFDNAFHWMIVSSPFISICDFCPRRQ